MVEENVGKIKVYLKDIHASVYEIENLVDAESFEAALLHSEWLENHVGYLTVLLADRVNERGNEK